MGKVHGMDEMELRRRIYDIVTEICHYSQVQMLAKSEFQKKYFQMQIDEVVNELFDLVVENPIIKQEINQKDASQQAVKEFTIDEIAQYDGKQGKPSYVAVNGNVYDVSKVLQWEGGNHFGMIAGKNLSDEFMTCHDGSLQILQKLPVVGVIKK